MKASRVIRVNTLLIPERSASRWISLYAPIVERIIQSFPAGARSQSTYDEDDLRQIGFMAILEGCMTYDGNRRGHQGRSAAFLTHLQNIIKWRMKEAIQFSFRARSTNEIGGLVTTTMQIELGNHSTSDVGGNMVSDVESHEDELDFASVAEKVNDVILSFDIRDRGFFADYLQDVSPSETAELNGVSSALVRSRVRAMLTQIKHAIAGLPVPEQPARVAEAKHAEPRPEPEPDQAAADAAPPTPLRRPRARRREPSGELPAAG